MNPEFYSYAIGIGTRNKHGQWLEVYYPAPVFKPAAAEIQAIATALGYQGGNTSIELTDASLGQLQPHLNQAQQAIVAQIAGSTQPRVITLLETDAALASTPEAYLKLHLLSHRHVLPNQINLAGIFAQLPNVAWTNRGAIDLAELPEAQTSARARGELLEVAAVDKFPKMTNYVVPSGVRIANTARVRLGAYLGEGTTVMHEGFVNFNAGTEGQNMVEGRLSQGVIMHAGSDLGGGASTMGTLSGGGQLVLSVGRDCLIGANAGTALSPQWTVTAAGSKIEFSFWWDTESSTTYDKFYAYLYVNGVKTNVGAATTPTNGSIVYKGMTGYTTSKKWATVSLDVSAYVGKSVQIQFYFN